MFRVVCSYLVAIAWLGGALTINILIDRMKQNENYA